MEKEIHLRMTLSEYRTIVDALRMARQEDEDLARILEEELLRLLTKFGMQVTIQEDEGND